MPRGRTSSFARTAPLDKITTSEPCDADLFVIQYRTVGHDGLLFDARFTVRQIRVPQDKKCLHIVFRDNSIVGIFRATDGTFTARVVSKEITPE